MKVISFALLGLHSCRPKHQCQEGQTGLSSARQGGKDGSNGKNGSNGSNGKKESIRTQTKMVKVGPLKTKVPYGIEHIKPTKGDTAVMAKRRWI